MANKEEEKEEKVTEEEKSTKITLSKPAKVSVKKQQKANGKAPKKITKLPNGTIKKAY